MKDPHASKDQLDLANLWAEPPAPAQGCCGACGRGVSMLNGGLRYCYDRMTQMKVTEGCEKWVPEGTIGCTRWSADRGWWKTGDPEPSEP